jgi:hypothetical protein
MNNKDLNPSFYTVEVISKEDVEKQQNNFDNLMAKLEKADLKEITKVLSQREIVEPESELTPKIIERIKAKIKDKK